MNSLALSMLGIQTEPALSDKWAALFGVLEPKPVELPPVPASVYGLQLQIGYWRTRNMLRNRRRNVIVQYLRDNGGLTTDVIATQFGITQECAYQELADMHREGRIVRNGKAPYVWKAA